MAEAWNEKLNDIMEDLMVGHKFNYALVEIEALLTEAGKEGYKAGYIKGGSDAVMEAIQARNQEGEIKTWLSQMGKTLHDLLATEFPATNFTVTVSEDGCYNIDYWSNLGRA